MKKYKFTISRCGNTKPKEINVKEKDLTPQQKELLIGTYLNDFNNLPEDVQEQISIKIFMKRYLVVLKK